MARGRDDAQAGRAHTGGAHITRKDRQLECPPPVAGRGCLGCLCGRLRRAAAGASILSNGSVGQSARGYDVMTRQVPDPLTPNEPHPNEFDRTIAAAARYACTLQP